MKILVSTEKLIELEVVSKTKLGSKELEERIKEFTKVISKDNDCYPDITIISRYDCHLLECRRSAVPIESILGVLEDFSGRGMNNDGNIINPLLDITILQGLSAPSWSNDFPRYKLINAPHKDWIRKSKLMKDVTRNEKVTDVKCLWADLRNNEVDLLSPSDCCLFLRTLLGSSHFATPWGDCDDIDNNYDTVGVMLAKYSGALKDFRTSDASPSFFLHSITQLQVPSGEMQLFDEDKNKIHCLGKIDATLYIYRRLPPRDLLHRPTHFAEVVPSGCLLETYFRQSSSQEDTENEYPILEQFVRPVAPPYISFKQDYPGLLEPLLEDLDIIFDEATSIPEWTAWPEKNHYSSHPNNPNAPTWTVFPLCHCFPANDVSQRKWIQLTCAHVPRTVMILKQYLGNFLRTALFSRLEPETTLAAHTGWEDLANHVYRVHIPLRVPPDGLCGTWVDGIVETHERGRPICFDDSKVHRAFNYSKFDRIVLIIDLERPPNLPIGTASGGHTEELDNFINTLT